MLGVQRLKLFNKALVIGLILGEYGGADLQTVCQVLQPCSLLSHLELLLSQGGLHVLRRDRTVKVLATSLNVHFEVSYLTSALLDVSSQVFKVKQELSMLLPSTLDFCGCLPGRTRTPRRPPPEVLHSMMQLLLLINLYSSGHLSLQFFDLCHQLSLLLLQIEVLFNHCVQIFFQALAVVLLPTSTTYDLILL